MPDHTPPKPAAKKSGLFGKILFGLLFLAAIVVAGLVFLAWQALNHPGTPAAGTASEPNNGHVEIWQPNGARSASQVYAPTTGHLPPAASEAALPEPEDDTPPARNNRTADAPPAEPPPPAEVPIQPVNPPPAAETEIKPVNTPPARRQQSAPENPVDNLF